MNAPARRDNCLTLVRYLAAADVLYGHFTRHLALSAPAAVDVLFRWLAGVPVFFFLSGFLVWRSTAAETAGTFARKRFLRLYPALWGAVAAEMISILILYKEKIRWGGFLLFGAAQGSVLQFWTPSFLRGYGCGTPNGALWTIGIFVQFYILVWWIAKVLRGKSVKVWGAVLTASVLIGLASPLFKRLLPTIVYKLYGQTVLPYLWIFLFGCFLSEYFDKVTAVVKRFWYLPAAASLIWCFAVPWDITAGSYPLVGTVLICLAALGFAYAFPKLEPKFDLSYEIYLYHMIVVNGMIALGLSGGIRFGWLALAVTVLFAVLSYLTVGRLTRKKREKYDRATDLHFEK